MSKINSLADYATKRFRLAGKAYLEGGDPFFAATDSLRQEAKLKGRRFVSFANYDYLGLASHPAVKAAAAAALETFGAGALASRLVGGERSTHRQLEAALAGFLRADAALTSRQRLSDQCDDDFAHIGLARRPFHRRIVA